MKLLSNFQMTSHFPGELELSFFPLDRPGRNTVSVMAKWFRLARCADAVVVINTTGLLTIVTVAAKLTSFKRTKVFLWDANLRRPVNVRSWAGCILMRFVFLFVDQFMVMHKDLEGYEKFYKIRPSKCVYISWKANNIHRADEMDKEDKGYVLACGASHRDYDTFNKAMRQNAYPAQIVLPEEWLACQHNSYLNDGTCPENVRVIRHDRNAGTWDAYLAHARVIVVPVMRGTLQPAGIATCFQAMALGKPVVISRGASTTGIIPEDAALFYDPGDAETLNQQLEKLWGDPGLRKSLGDRGRAFVRTLGDEKRIEKDIQQAILQFRNS